MKIWGIIAILYAAVVVVITVVQPEKIWEMKKIKFFRKTLGDKGTEIFFYVWALIFLILGVWLLAQ
jgi:hypothetical protein